MQKEFRLRKTRDFSLVYRVGRSWANDFLVLKAMPNHEVSGCRFGFSVGKRTGNAVMRNTIKRRLRETVRQTPVKAGWDIVFIARARARNASYHRLKASATSLLRRADLLALQSETERASA
ncbi:MAG: ribonuclease P protein component [Chloroflexota bacterium]|nr:ribonuclease P protein component [Chloroflexota bacterium]MDE2942035.1 ribonuclease P protein component [Chloroflexota bacterium]MDE3266907.1 ribonuclease P protein component [Chloroflexota bacterium]